jgi:hypothetical protein
MTRASIFAILHCFHQLSLLRLFAFDKRSKILGKKTLKTYEEYITFAASFFNSFIASLVAVRLYSLALKITCSWRAALLTSAIFAFSLNTWEL